MNSWKSSWNQGVHIDRNEPVANASGRIGTKEGVGVNVGRKSEPAGVYGIVYLIGNLRMVVLILDCAAIVVEDTEAQINLGDLRVDRPVEYPVPAANHCFVVLEWVPRERHSGCKILVVGIQRKIFRVDFIADPVV